MKKNELSFGEQLINTCQLPKDIVWGASLMSVTGNKEMLVENFKSIIKFNSEEIMLQCKNYQITIMGKDLKIDIYTKEELKVIGTIHEIKFL